MKQQIIKTDEMYSENSTIINSTTIGSLIAEKIKKKVPFLNFVQKSPWVMSWISKHFSAVLAIFAQ